MKITENSTKIIRTVSFLINHNSLLFIFYEIQLLSKGWHADFSGISLNETGYSHNTCLVDRRAISRINET